MLSFLLSHSFVQSDRWFYIDDGPLFETLPHVIDHYSRCADGLPVLLKMALPPDGNPPIVIQNIPVPPTRKRPPLTPALSSPALNIHSARILAGRNLLQRSGSAVSTCTLRLQVFLICLVFTCMGDKAHVLIG